MPAQEIGLPRRCGADRLVWSCKPPIRGSSPQVRGRRAMAPYYCPTGRLIPAGAGQTGNSHLAFVAVERLIPAGAGQTPGSRSRSPRCRAHPRRCGADLTGNFDNIGNRGSSPQVRGRL